MTKGGGKFHQRREPISGGTATAERPAKTGYRRGALGVARAIAVVSRSRAVSAAVTIFDDAGLVRAFSNGESWAAREIWNRHAPMVQRLLERALGPNGEADDLMQEVFVRIFATLPSCARAVRSAASSTQSLSGS